MPFDSRAVAFLLQEDSLPLAALNIRFTTMWWTLSLCIRSSFCTALRTAPWPCWESSRSQSRSSASSGDGEKARPGLLSEPPESARRRSWCSNDVLSGDALPPSPSPSEESPPTPLGIPLGFVLLASCSRICFSRIRRSLISWDKVRVSLAPSYPSLLSLGVAAPFAPSSVVEVALPLFRPKTIFSFFFLSIVVVVVVVESTPG
mmetsp:Transcript_3169/g.8777  ORF Transcript_3169/g.8777 Transcript_3169/m.8777 type:complete len:204 (+) Transcript_3169:1385-1996(+)